MVNHRKVLVKKSKYIWQGYPFARYILMAHKTSGIHDTLEHINSTLSL
jgi:hypothetical protein